MEFHLPALIGAGGQAAVDQRDHQYGREDDQHGAFQELDVGRRSHACRSDDRDYNRADHDHPPEVRNAQQRFNQHARANHLGDEVTNRDHQGAHRGCQLNPARVVVCVNRIGKCVFTQTLQGLCNHEQCHDPTSQVANRVKKAVVTDGGDHAANTKERSRREIISCERDPVHPPMDISTRSVITARCFCLISKIK